MCTCQARRVGDREMSEREQHTLHTSSSLTHRPKKRLRERTPNANLPPRGEVQVLLRHAAGMVRAGAAALALLFECAAAPQPTEAFLDVGRYAILWHVKVALQRSRHAVDDVRLGHACCCLSNPPIDRVDIVRLAILRPCGVRKAHGRDGKREVRHASVGAETSDQALQLVAVFCGIGILRGGKRGVGAGQRGSGLAAGVRGAADLTVLFVW